MYDWRYAYGSYYPRSKDAMSYWATDYPQALEMIKQAVQGERNDELFYDDLISLAPTREQKTIISSIRDDERIHNRIYRTMYRQLTGQDVPAGSGDEPYAKPSSYATGLAQALFGELGAVEKYRTIAFSLPCGPYRENVVGIIMDEQKHADKYNYLLGLTKASAR
ncbi:ferritin-like domain-containing protein [Cohnella suwonensis]|uniref:Ferritin-like domain-containing protein n=1 Tax=Cohnella suwonensis TaxID=696072 RepID=A0ABW0LRA8_9BACL